MFTVTDQSGETDTETGIITINQPMQYTPNIACTTDSTSNKVTVAMADANIIWTDISITTNPTTTWRLCYNGGVTMGANNTYPSPICQ